MSIQTEIFNRFFTKLEENSDIPVETIEELKKRYLEMQVITEKYFLEAIEKGSDNGN